MIIDDSKKKDEEVRTQEINDDSLDWTPEFYRNLGNQPSLARLREMGVAERIPFIVEILQGTCKTDDNDIFFKNNYTKPPLVNGLLLKADGKCIPVYPDGEIMFATTLKVVLKDTALDTVEGGKYKLRVYNLDLLQ